MAKLAQLIEAVSSNSGVPLPTVSLTARHVREAGLISSGGRGPGGAEMTPTDATNLLIGTVAAMQVKDAPEVVKLFRSARPIKNDWGEDHAAARLPIADFANLPFGDMLDEIFRQLAAAGDICEDESDEPIELELEFQRTGHGYSVSPVLTINRPSEKGEVVERYLYHANNPDFDRLTPTQRDAHARKLFSAGGIGLTVTATVRDYLIYPIADCLAGRKVLQEAPL